MRARSLVHAATGLAMWGRWAFANDRVTDKKRRWILSSSASCSASSMAAGQRFLRPWANGCEAELANALQRSKAAVRLTIVYWSSSWSILPIPVRSAHSPCCPYLYLIRYLGCRASSPRSNTRNGGCSMPKMVFSSFARLVLNPSSTKRRSYNTGS